MGNEGKLFGLCRPALTRRKPEIPWMPLSAPAHVYNKSDAKPQES
jgi:hypothetical protein